MKKPIDFFSLNKDYSVFVPAISEMYSRYVSDPNPRRVPPAPLIKEDLNFLNPNSKLYFIRNCLYSAGQVAKTDKAALFKDMVTLRDPAWRTNLIGDSGGFQIETGAIKWEGIKTQKRILKWLEDNCDWSMILDFPTGSISRRGIDTYYSEYLIDNEGNQILEEFDSIDSKGRTRKIRKPQEIKHKLDFWFCLQRTMENNDYFIKNRTPGATKFLNVLQGRYHDFDLDEDFIENFDPNKYTWEEKKALLNAHKISEVDMWYAHVKKYSRDFSNRNFEGWALAGKHKEHFAITLRRIVIMLNEGMLQEKPWMHFLGMGKTKNGCVYTTIQRGIRNHEYGNKDFTISYDVSSPFTTAAFGNVLAKFTLTKESWRMNMDKVDGIQWIGSSAPMTGQKYGEDMFRSPISEYITMKDICINNDPNLSSTWDVAAYAFIMNHNVSVHMSAVLEAQKIYDLPLEESKELVPSYLLEIKRIVEDILVLPKHKALSEIKKYRTE